METRNNTSKEYAAERQKQRHLNMTIKVLKEQVEIFRDRIDPPHTGHLHTTKSVMNHRISELEQRSGLYGHWRTQPNQILNSGLLPRTKNIFCPVGCRDHL